MTQRPLGPSPTPAQQACPAEPAQPLASEQAIPPVLTPAAERALQEANERRRASEAKAAHLQREIGGQSGPDPVRYGDWEKGGIVSDF